MIIWEHWNLHHLSAQIFQNKPQNSWDTSKILAWNSQDNSSKRERSPVTAKIHMAPILEEEIIAHSHSMTCPKLHC